MARRRKGRPVDGVFLLDKPTGISSNDALQKVKRIYHAQKAGHTGALDPLATGMLPICLGEATKFSQYLLDSDKRYLVRARLGIRTDTSDSDGDIVCERPVTVQPGQVIEALDHFRGAIEQVPSMYSALKHQGKPLYWYARQGIEIEREARPVTVYDFRLLNMEDDVLEMEVHCSKGTYVRTLVDDLGEMLGCGAHVIMLRRTQVADYPTERMLTLEQLECLFEQVRSEDRPPREALDPLLLPMDTAVSQFPEVNMMQMLGDYVQQGQAVQVPGAPLDGLVRMTVGPERLFIGVGHIDDDGRVAPKRLVVFPSEA